MTNFTFTTQDIDNAPYRQLQGFVKEVQGLGHIPNVKRNRKAAELRMALFNLLTRLAPTSFTQDEEFTVIRPYFTQEEEFGVYRPIEAVETAIVQAFGSDDTEVIEAEIVEPVAYFTQEEDFGPTQFDALSNIVYNVQHGLVDTANHEAEEGTTVLSDEVTAIVPATPSGQLATINPVAEKPVVVASVIMVMMTVLLKSAFKALALVIGFSIVTAQKVAKAVKPTKVRKSRSHHTMKLIKRLYSANS